MGTDASIVNAARVSFGNNIINTARLLDDNTRLPIALTDLPVGDRKLISFLMRNKHASPFEHCTLQFAIETTIAVSREAMRHRTFSFNEFSTRYSEISNDAGHANWYIPDADHMRTQTGKPGSYFFTPITDVGTIVKAQDAMDYAYGIAYNTYTLLLRMGVAKEIARNVLPLGTTTTFYMSGNLRNWFNFLVLRNSPAALQEIRDIAERIEWTISVVFPAAYAAWLESGRPQI
jgi:thymidylate synthase, flavin-dependent